MTVAIYAVKRIDDTPPQFAVMPENGSPDDDGAIVRERKDSEGILFLWCMRHRSAACHHIDAVKQYTQGLTRTEDE